MKQGNVTKLAQFAAGVLLTATMGMVSAAPVTYNIDASHTYPSFEADHMGGLSVWRGKVNSNSGTVVLDTEAETGSVEVSMDMTTIDFGHDGMNDHAKKDDILDVEQYPTATYTGTLGNFVDGAPTTVEGNLTLHGVTKPVSLEITRFKCMVHPMKKIDVCGADAAGSIDRSDFGVDYAKAYGFDMAVKLLISIEAAVAK